MCTAMFCNTEHCSTYNSDMVLLNTALAVHSFADLRSLLETINALACAKSRFLCNCKMYSTTSQKRYNICKVCLLNNFPSLQQRFVVAIKVSTTHVLIDENRAYQFLVVLVWFVGSLTYISEFINIVLCEAESLKIALVFGSVEIFDTYL